jgi:integrase/recombinase XerD
MNKVELDQLLDQKEDFCKWSDETRQALRELITEYDKEMPQQQPKSSINTAEAIGQFLDYNKAAGLQPYSIQSYGQALNPFARELPTLPTTQQEIEGFLGNKPSGATRLWVYKVLTVFYRFASKRFGVPNIMAKIAKPRVKPKEPDSLTKNQAKMLLDAIETDRERGLVYLYLGQGLRLSEAVRLDVHDVGDDLLRIEGKERQESMPLLAEVRAALLKVIGNRGYNEPVFIGQRGRLGRDMAELIVKRLFRRAGVNGVKQSPHTLRHTFASLATAAGCDTYSVERLLRHRSSGRNVTYLYIHLSMQELREKLEMYSPLRLIEQQSKDSAKLLEG